MRPPGQRYISLFTNVSMFLPCLIAVVAKYCAAATLAPFNSGALSLHFAPL
jgi:hypothetical protein